MLDVEEEEEEDEDDEEEWEEEMIWCNVLCNNDRNIKLVVYFIVVISCCL